MYRHTILQVFHQLKVGVVGAPFNLGQPRIGVRDGPRVIRNTGFIRRLEQLGHDVIDAGDVHPDEGILSEKGPSGERNHPSVLSYNQKLADTIEKIRSDDRMVVTLGGDHSTAIGSIAGHSQGTPYKQMIVLWIDAHADINTGRTSPSGNMHGMPLSYLLNETRNKVNKLPGSEWPSPVIEAKHLAYIGLRDIDVLEQKLLDDLGILNFGMRDVDRIGIQECIARSLDQLQPTENRSLHVSFDIDVLDPSEAPSTGTPVHGGLSLREGLSIMEAAHSTGRLRGLDLVEVNPTIGSTKDGIQTAESAKAIILAGAAGMRA